MTEKWEDIRDEMPFDSTVEWSPVNTKADFVRRYKSGEFGNASPTFDTPKEYLESGFHGSGLIHIRNRNRNSGNSYYDVPPEEFDTRWRMACEHAPPDSYYISMMAPTEKTIIQGELQYTNSARLCQGKKIGDPGLEFYYTTVKKPMRYALQEESHTVDHITAKGLLQLYMNNKSYEWLKELLDRYPGHVIEFSVYSVEWGTIPGYNTVFWEVRNY